MTAGPIARHPPSTDDVGVDAIAAAPSSSNAVRGSTDAGDEWALAAIWLDTVRLNGGDFSEETANTYTHHLAKLRWYCERVIDLSPARWTEREANGFANFLRELPIEALCVQVDTGRRRVVGDREVPVLRHARRDEDGYRGAHRIRKK